jgi:UDP-galactopyranose mutase
MKEGTNAAPATKGTAGIKPARPNPPAGSRWGNVVPLVAFSHLRWDFVFQRPQHIMTRIGRERLVLFVEEPVVRPGAPPSLEIETVSPGVRVARPSLPMNGTPFGDSQQRALHELLQEQMDRDRWTSHAAWLFTPMAVRLAKSLHPHVIVYDCMDPLAAFEDAPPELVERERELLAAADVVMTGGHGLYRDMCDHHSFVRCYPSSVEVEHFANPGAEPADQAGIPRPVLGFHGVIDERMDLELVAALAATHPDWQIVLIGPVVKIEPAALPMAENIHYLGQKSYPELPAYLAGWDAALMPFVIGPATRSISPTKVLEYMAADRPIVSTPVADVVAGYRDIVHVGEGPDAFIAACEQALHGSGEERERRRERARAVVHRTSWDETVRRMGLIVHFLADPAPTPEIIASSSGRVLRG